MSEPASDDRVHELLQQIKSIDPGTRAEASRLLGASGSLDPAVLKALDRLKVYDDDEAVRAAGGNEVGCASVPVRLRHQRRKVRPTPPRSVPG